MRAGDGGEKWAGDNPGDKAGVKRRKKRTDASDNANGAAAESRAGPVLLVVLPRISEVDDFAVDLAGLLRRDPEILPAWESVPKAQQATDPVFTGRMRVLRQFAGGSEQPVDQRQRASQRPKVSNRRRRSRSL